MNDFETLKECPNCGQQVLEAAPVCKFCRHRFSNEPIDLAIDSRGAQTGHLERHRTRLALIGIAMIAIGIAAFIVLSSGGGGSGDGDPEADDVLSSAQLESSLESQIQSRTGTPVESISCPEGGGQNESASCDVTFADGEVQPILVDIEAVSPNPRVQIRLPDE